MLETIIRRGIVVPIGSHSGKEIIFANDHRGYQLKLELVDYLKNGYVLTDLGTHSNVRCDYPDYARFLGDDVSRYFLSHVGIAICGSGIGIGIAVNKFPRIIAARCLTEEDAISSRKHNNSNVLVLGADITKIDAAKKIVDAWLNAKFYESQKDEVYLNRYVQTINLEYLARPI